MTATPEISTLATTPKVISFWERLLTDQELRDCAPLEKILLGCELIAALDEGELLAA